MSIVLENKPHDKQQILIENTAENDAKKPLKFLKTPSSPAPEESKRNVKLKNVGNAQTLVITQRVELTQPTIKCIINVRTNVCSNRKHKKHSHKKKKEKKKDKKIEERFVVKDRIVPVCFRSSLCCRKARDQLSKESRDSTHNPKNKDVAHNKKHRKHRERVKRSHHQEHRHKIEKKRIKSKSILSFSLSPKKDDFHNLIYEDISDNALSLENEIDLLIKRTKEREHNMVRQQWLSGHQDLEPISLSESFTSEFTRDSANLESSEQQYLEPISPSPFLSPVIHTSDNGTVFSSEMDVSIHSLSTVVLDPDVDTDAYSPTLKPFETNPANLSIFDRGLSAVNDKEFYLQSCSNELSQDKRFTLQSNNQDSVKNNEGFMTLGIKQEIQQDEDICWLKIHPLKNIEIESQIMKELEELKQEPLTP